MLKYIYIYIFIYDVYIYIYKFCVIYKIHIVLRVSDVQIVYVFSNCFSRNWVRYTSFTKSSFIKGVQQKVSIVPWFRIARFGAHSIRAMKLGLWLLGSARPSATRCSIAFICIIATITTIISVNTGDWAGFVRCRPTIPSSTSSTSTQAPSTTQAPQPVATLTPALTNDLLGWPTETPLPGRVKLSQSSCTYEPSVSRRCHLWCLQPEWTKKKPGGKRLKCCSGDGHIVERDPAPYKMVVAYLYTGEEQMLRTHFRTWAKFSNDVLRQLRFLFAIETQDQIYTRNNRAEWIKKPPNTTISFGTPTSPADVLFQEFGNLSRKPDVHMVAVQEHLNWNVGGKRNLLMHVADSWHVDSWVLLTDMDMKISESFFKSCLDIILDSSSKRKLHKFQRQKPTGEMKPHPGTWLMKTGLYWQSGGCDEDFVGSYGQTDPHFDYRAKQTNHDGVELHDNMVLIEMDQKKTGHRNIHRNAGLFALKRQDRIRWSNDYLRFAWGLVDCR